MEDENEIKKAINDLEEDHREEGESIEDEYREGGDDHVTNDIAEDHREEGESIEDVKNALRDALYENSMLKQELARASSERDEAHRVFLGNSKESDTSSSRNYSSIVGDIR